MIGSGVFMLPASLAPFGGLSFVGWLVSAGGAMLLAMVFAFLSRRHPAAGGIYAYSREGFGDLAGFLVAWGYWISIWAANAALSVAFVGYLKPFIPSIVGNPASAALLAVVTLWVLTAVNSRGVVTAGRVQVVTTTLKLLPLVIVGIGGLMLFEPTHFAVSAAPAGGQRHVLFQVITMTMFAFVGLESATIPAATVRDPARTIPRATIIGTLVTAVIYIASTAGAMSLVPPASLAASSAPFAEAARALGGQWLERIVAGGAAISAFGALNGWIMVASQLSLAVARDGVFPKPFARVNATGVPIVGMVIAGVLSTGLIALNYSPSQNLVALFTTIMLIATLATLVPYTFCTLAVFMPAGDGKTALSPAMAITAALAFLFALVAIAGAGADVVFFGFFLLLAGLPVYVWVRRGR
jgi:APA family basic amino acid/polyamine antiporter